jgi:hypothetical protein
MGIRAKWHRIDWCSSDWRSGDRRSGNWCAHAWRGNRGGSRRRRSSSRSRWSVVCGAHSYRQKTDSHRQPTHMTTIECLRYAVLQEKYSIGNYGRNGSSRPGRNGACPVSAFHKGVQARQRTITRSIAVARPDLSSQSTTTPHRRTSWVAASNREGIPLRNFSITSSFFTPITLL